MKLAIVGAGVAGVSAALAARDRGADVVVFAAHAGGSHLAGGAWDVASPVAASPVEQLAPRASLRDAVAAIARTSPEHAYARLGADPVEAVSRAHDRVLGALAIYRPLDLAGPGELVATELGRIRRTGTAQRPVLAVSAHERATIAVGSLRGLRAFDAAFVAASLAEQVDRARDERRFGMIDVEFFRRRADGALLGHEIAATLDGGEARTRLAAALGRALGGSAYAAVLLPAVLGLEIDTVVESVAMEAGVPVGEVVTSLGGAQSSRLVRRLRDVLVSAGVEIRDARVASVSAGTNDVIVSVEGAADPATFDALVLATGKLLGGGVIVRRGVFTEPLTGHPIERRTTDPLVAFGASPFDRGPGFRTGVRVDERMRVLDVDGRVASECLFAAGAVLAGADPADGTGLGVACATGFAAGLAAAGRPSQ